METRLPWRPTRGSLTSPSHLVRKCTLGSPLKNHPETPPSSRRGGPSSPAWPRGQPRDLSPNASGGLTPFSPPNELQQITVATREQSGFVASTRDECLSPRGRLECNPEIPVAPGEEHWLLDTSLDDVYWPCSHSRAIPSFPSQLEWKIALPWANTRGILNSPSELENPAATREKPRGSPVIAR